MIARPVATVDHQLATFFGKHTGYALSDARAASGNKRALSLKL